MIAVIAVILGGMSMFFSSLYGEKYFLYFTTTNAMTVIITVEIIHHAMKRKPFSESIFSIPDKRSWILPVSGSENNEVAIPTTI